MADDDQWLTRMQAAERLGINVRTVDRWVANGWLTRYETVSGLARFRAEDVEALAEPRRKQ